MSRRKETQQECQKEEVDKTLALPNDKEMSQTARRINKPGNELVKQTGEEKMKIGKQLKIIKEMTGRHDLKMALMKRENMTKDTKHDLIATERQKALLELYLKMKKSENSRMDIANEKKENQLKQLEKIFEKESCKYEEFLRNNEKKSVAARAFFEQEAKSKQKMNVEIKKLTAEIMMIKCEVAKFEEILINYRRYKELLFQLSPPEWQEAQMPKALKVKFLSDRAQHSIEPVESPIRNGLDNKVFVPYGMSIKETTLSSAHSDALIKTCKVESNSFENEDEPDLYFTDPQQLLDLVRELTEQNLSLFHVSTNMENTLKELRRSLERTKKNIEKDEEPVKMWIIDMHQRINKEKSRGSKLKQKVQILGSLDAEDEDVMLAALDKKVSKVHRLCTDDRITNRSTLEKLGKIENYMSLLLQCVESIPEENFKMLNKIMSQERRSRQCEEKSQEQKEKHEEKMRRYLERSHAVCKKMTGKKLMKMSMPFAQKIRVCDVDHRPSQDDIRAYLYTSDDN